MSANVAYNRIKFRQKEDYVEGRFMRMFVFKIYNDQLDVLGPYAIEKNGSISFPEANQQDAEVVMDKLTDIGLTPQHLRNTISGNPVNYIYEGCGVPLIGSNVFGVVDRGMSLIEVKPITSCNLHCTYCSVGEGGNEKKYDFVIEPEYLADTVRQVMHEKGLDHDGADVEIHMSVHGEPFMYSEMITLTKLLKEIPGVLHIATDTNGTYLTKEFIDELAEAGFTRLNFSLDSMEPELSYKMVGKKYNHAHLLEMIRYTAQHPKMDCLIAPVWVQGVNDEQIPKLVQFAKENNIIIGIQNYMNYKYGRFVQKEITWEQFKAKLEELEKENDYKLIMNMPKDFKMYKVDQIKKTMKKNQTVEVEIKMEGNNPGEMLGVANERVITIPFTHAKVGDRIKVKITREKHNIFYGIPVHEKLKMENVQFGNLAP